MLEAEKDNKSDGDGSSTPEENSTSPTESFPHLNESESNSETDLKEKSKVDTTEEAESKSPDEAESKSPDEAESKSPDEAESQSPDDGESQSPDHVESQSPDGAEIKSPDDGEIKSPDEAESKSPDEAESESPDEAESKSPDGAEIKSPDDGEIKSPDEAESKSPDGAESKSPDDVESKSPDEAESKLLEEAENEPVIDKEDQDEPAPHEIEAAENNEQPNGDMQLHDELTTEAEEQTEAGPTNGIRVVENGPIENGGSPVNGNSLDFMGSGDASITMVGDSFPRVEVKVERAEEAVDDEVGNSGDPIVLEETPVIPDVDEREEV
ncbi:putative formin-like protein 3 [Apostichopus japonicus]|uniref:Putative formin-like protein 3 n=1 Tax=Stichopus japonicus TaxID=307972 RepID=A0A2G8LDX2_STIJA|nr:putative formin-like protein 3 [Apostichopus japonicus]